MSGILIILLGCHISHLLFDRVNAALNFANHYNQSNVNYYELYEYKINWFLSGGIKNTKEDTITEAEKMKQLIMSKNAEDYNWNYIMDEISINTAENFIVANQIEDRMEFSDVYVITSEFHYERAKKMADLIDVNSYKWILSNEEENNSRYWEKIHMKNVEKDIINAKRHLLVR